MGTYYKPQSPIQSGEDFIYPLTTADQIMKSDNSRRLEQAGLIVADNSASLGGVAAEDYALKTDTAQDSSKLGGVAASEYALKTDTAQDSSKLGGKAPEYYIQPRNLLDNSDFTNPVNQRGIGSGASIAAYTYFIDRWVNQTSEARSFTLSASGVGLPVATTLLQKDENIQAGKVVTFAIKLSDGTIATLTGTVQYASDGAWMRFASITHSFGDMYMETMDGRTQVVVYNTKAITIEWAALYEGSYTADTLPPYVPKGYAAELAECQRYYVKFKQVAPIPVWAGYALSQTVARILFPLPVPMRVVPTVAIGTLENVLLLPSDVSAQGIRNINITGNAVTVEFTTTGLTTNMSLVARIYTSIEFNGDL